MAGGTLLPRENSPYRHRANKDSISTPELGGVFVFPASRIPACALCEPIRRAKLTKSQLGQAGYHKSRRITRAPCNHLCRFPVARGNVVSFPPTPTSAISCTVWIRIDASSMLSLFVGKRVR